MMEALILLAIGVIATPILLIITHSSKKVSSQKTTESSSNSSVSHSFARNATCPRCGSPVIVYRDGWECGWCGDSGRW